MAGDELYSYDMVNGCYDVMDSCNKCGGANDQITLGCVYDPEHSGEAKTQCTVCGHVDWWAFGHFESSEDGLDASDKYFNIRGRGLVRVERDVYEQYLKYLIEKGNARTAS